MATPGEALIGFGKSVTEGTRSGLRLRSVEQGRERTIQANIDAAALLRKNKLADEQAERERADEISEKLLVINEGLFQVKKTKDVVTSAKSGDGFSEVTFKEVPVSTGTSKAGPISPDRFRKIDLNNPQVIKSLNDITALDPTGKATLDTITRIEKMNSQQNEGFKRDIEIRRGAIDFVMAPGPDGGSPSKVLRDKRLTRLAGSERGFPKDVKEQALKLSNLDDESQRIKLNLIKKSLLSTDQLNTIATADTTFIRESGKVRQKKEAGENIAIDRLAQTTRGQGVAVDPTTGQQSISSIRVENMYKARKAKKLAKDPDADTSFEDEYLDTPIAARDDLLERRIAIAEDPAKIKGPVQLGQEQAASKNLLTGNFATSPAVTTIEPDGSISILVPVTNKRTGETKINRVPIAGDIIDRKFGETSEEFQKRKVETVRQSEAAKLGAQAQGIAEVVKSEIDQKGISQRVSTRINKGLDQAAALPNINRSIELMELVKTGGFANAKLRAKQFLGMESADEAELFGNLGKAVVSQLKKVFGAAFTEREGALLARIEAGFGKSTAGNIRLLNQAKKLLTDSANRAIRQAKAIRDKDTVLEIQDLMSLTLTPDPEGAAPETQTQGTAPVTEQTQRNVTVDF